MSNQIQTEWERYLATVLNPTASEPITMDDVRMAFIAGLAAALPLVLEGPEGVTLEAMKARMLALTDELVECACPERESQWTN